MKTIQMSPHCRTITIPHLCSGDDDKRERGPLGPPYREFSMGEGDHTICCDGCNGVWQFRIVKKKLH